MAAAVLTLECTVTMGGDVGFSSRGRGRVRVGRVAGARRATNNHQREPGPQGRRRLRSRRWRAGCLEEGLLARFLRAAMSHLDGRAVCSTNSSPRERHVSWSSAKRTHDATRSLSKAAIKLSRRRWGPGLRWVSRERRARSVHSCHSPPARSKP